MFDLTLNQGKFEPLGINARALDSARTGQIGDFNNLSMESNFTWLFFCVIFDHLNITSPLAKCLSGEKSPAQWGTKLDSLKNEKKLSRYTALKI